MVVARDIKKLAIRRSTIRSLAGRERYGQEILAELQLMGIRTGPNYLYEILAEMEDEGLLKGRWAPNPIGKPDRHYYSLAEGGKKELDRMVRDSIDLISEMVLMRRMRESPRMLTEVLSKLGSPLPRGRLVVALPDGDPGLAYWLHLHSLVGNLREVSLYVVKPPDGRFRDPPPGVTVLDGRRNDLPLKDGFADFLLVSGLPRDSPLEAAAKEFARVLNPAGHLLLRQSNSFTEDRAPRYMTGYEHWANLVYEVYDRDKTVNVRALLRVLSKSFRSVNDEIIGGSTWVHAHSKKP